MYIFCIISYLFAIFVIDVKYENTFLMLKVSFAGCPSWTKDVEIKAVFQKISVLLVIVFLHSWTDMFNMFQSQLDIIISAILTGIEENLNMKTKYVLLQ